MLHSRLVVGILVLLNAVVLLGQLWPEGAPPFARGVNIGFLLVSLLYFVSELLGRHSRRETAGGGRGRGA